MSDEWVQRARCEERERCIAEIRQIWIRRGEEIGATILASRQRLQEQWNGLNEAATALETGLAALNAQMDRSADPTSQRLTEQIVVEVISDVITRAGFDAVWDQIDTSTRTEILQSCKQKITRILFGTHYF